jgi:hypothetical protein
MDQGKEQASITLLHRGGVQIIPWPYINTPTFYSSLLRLRQQLERQQFTYDSGSTFLLNMKMMMAKIKVNNQCH